MNHLETFYFIYIVSKIAYIEYLEEAKNENFSFACLQNLNYIKSKLSNLNVDNLLNIVKNGNALNLNEIFNEKNLSTNKNRFVDNNIFEEEIKINLKTNSSIFMDGNEAYIILLSRNINIYSLKTKKILIKIEDDKIPNVIRFSPNDCNIFLSSSRDIVKIYEINNK